MVDLIFPVDQEGFKESQNVEVKNANDLTFKIAKAEIPVITVTIQIIIQEVKM